MQLQCTPFKDPTTIDIGQEINYFEAKLTKNVA